MKILLVDDSQLMSRYVAQLLGGRGHVVTLAGGLADAAQAFARARPDAILMDFILEGGVTGLEVLSALASLPGGKECPAAILTQGELARVDRAKAAALEIAVIQKPVRGDESAFFAAIDAWIGTLVAR